MKRIIRWSISRQDFSDKQTLGAMSIREGNALVEGSLATLEQEMSNNETDDSCIMPGHYIVVPHLSEKFGKCFKVLGTPGRVGILFHALNYHYQSKGCIGIGLGNWDLNKDGYVDITSSQKAMAMLVEKCWDENAKILLSIA